MSVTFRDQSVLLEKTQSSLCHGAGMISEGNHFQDVLVSEVVDHPRSDEKEKVETEKRQDKPPDLVPPIPQLVCVHAPGSHWLAEQVVAKGLSRRGLTSAIISVGASEVKCLRDAGYAFFENSVFMVPVAGIVNLGVDEVTLYWV